MRIPWLFSRLLFCHIGTTEYIIWIISNNDRKNVNIQTAVKAALAHACCVTKVQGWRATVRQENRTAVGSGCTEQECKTHRLSGQEYMDAKERSTQNPKNGNISVFIPAKKQFFFWNPRKPTRVRQRPFQLVEENGWKTSKLAIHCSSKTAKDIKTSSRFMTLKIIWIVRISKRKTPHCSLFVLFPVLRCSIGFNNNVHFREKHGWSSGRQGY